MTRLLNCGLLLCLAVTTAWAFGPPDQRDLRILDAVKRRDPKAVDTLLAQGADFNASAPDGATALAWAVFLDLPDIAGKLIAAGAKVNTTGDYGETPLTLALANGNVPLSEKLLKAGADWKVTRWNGETPLMIAAGVGSVEEVRMLLDRGADVNGCQPATLQNALMWAASEGHAAVVDLLIQRGANVNAASKSGFTPLVFAALKNDAPEVQRLLAAGANPNYGLLVTTPPAPVTTTAVQVAPPAPISTEIKVLSLAVSNRSYAASIALLDGGADPNIADQTGNTPLHVAAQTGALDLVKKLLAKRAALNVQTAQAAPNPFRPPAGEQTPLLLAARNNHVDVMRALIEAGADTNIKGQDGAGLLLAAASSGHIEATRYAFEFDKNVKGVDSNGLTAMHECVANPGSGATQEERTDLVQYLADIGVPLDEKDARGRTPIQTGDPIPLDKPIQRMADIIVDRGGTPVQFPKEYVKPGSSR